MPVPHVQAGEGVPVGCAGKNPVRPIAKACALASAHDGNIGSGIPILNGTIESSGAKYVNEQGARVNVTAVGVVGYVGQTEGLPLVQYHVPENVCGGVPFQSHK